MAAHEHNANVISISGLTIQSLAKMTHVTKEMEGQGFEVPLLKGASFPGDATETKTKRIIVDDD